ncbi:MAG: hypothetical protein GY917_03325 [Planctomycetaceae bacterium]|jgi:hypothetical protein|nr:hypothetical protein [Planctomycetaceae bacterium]MCP4814780.1 hypothetical protein [Planctomycetaceae bacterium]
MSNAKDPSTYKSNIPFETSRIQAAAVYCSDGRFGNQFDEFMQTGLGLPRYDRLAVPGGAACIARHFSTYREEEGVTEQLKFLVEVHDLERVVLIAHQGCAFYTERLRISPLQLEAQQQEDMQKAVQLVRSIGPNLRVDAFFARKRRDLTIQFETLEL